MVVEDWDNRQAAIRIIKRAERAAKTLKPH